MTMIGADGLSFWVGDGAGTETFQVLKGAIVTRFEISQRTSASTAVQSDAWQVSVNANTRRAIIECESLATDDAAPLRLRALMLNGASGNFRLKLNAGETLTFSASVALYREIIEAGTIKRLQCRLESTGPLSIG